MADALNVTKTSKILAHSQKNTQQSARIRSAAQVALDFQWKELSFKSDRERMYVCVIDGYMNLEIEKLF